jgi:DNA-binding response OmpR family regulator
MKKRIMIVEDDFVLAFDLQDLLRSRGYEPAGPFCDAQRALDFIAFDPPRAAILDYQLRDGPALPVAERLRELGIPYFWLTAHRRDIPAEHGKAPILGKPLTAADVIACLEKVVRQAERERSPLDQAFGLNEERLPHRRGAR